MFRINLMLYLLLLFSGVLQSQEKNSDKELIFAYDEKLIMEIGAHFNSTKIALESFAKKVNPKFNMRWYKTSDDLILALKNKEVTCGPLFSLSYLLKDNSELRPLFSAGGKYSVGPKLCFTILSHVDSSIKTMNDIKGKKLAKLKQEEVGTLFLSVELAKLGHKETFETFFKTVEYYETHEKAFYSVYFKKNDVCIIHDNTLKILADLNPVIMKKMNVLKVSDPFMIGALYTHKDIDENLRSELLQEAINLKENSSGNQILKMLRLNGIYEIEENSLDSVKEQLKQYEKLTGKPYDEMFKVHSEKNYE